MADSHTASPTLDDARNAYGAYKSFRQTAATVGKVKNGELPNVREVVHAAKTAKAVTEACQDMPEEYIGVVTGGVASARRAVTSLTQQQQAHHPAGSHRKDPRTDGTSPRGRVAQWGGVNLRVNEDSSASAASTGTPAPSPRVVADHHDHSHGFTPDRTTAIPAPAKVRAPHGSSGFGMSGFTAGIAAGRDRAAQVAGAVATRAGAARAPETAPGAADAGAGQEVRGAGIAATAMQKLSSTARAGREHVAARAAASTATGVGKTTPAARGAVNGGFETAASIDASAPASPAAAPGITTSGGRVASLAQAGRERVAAVAGWGGGGHKAEGAPAADGSTRPQARAGFERVSSLANAGRERVAAATGGWAGGADRQPQPVPAGFTKAASYARAGRDHATGLAANLWSPHGGPAVPAQDDVPRPGTPSAAGSGSFEKISSLAQSGRERMAAFAAAPAAAERADGTDARSSGSDAGKAPTPNISIPAGFTKIASFARAGRERVAAAATQRESQPDAGDEGGGAEQQQQQQPHTPDGVGTIASTAKAGRAHAASLAAAGRERMGSLAGWGDKQAGRDGHPEDTSSADTSRSQQGFEKLAAYATAGREHAASVVAAGRERVAAMRNADETVAGTPPAADAGGTTGVHAPRGFEKVSSLAKAGRKRMATIAGGEEAPKQQGTSEPGTSTGGFEKLSSLAKAGRDRVATMTGGEAEAHDPRARTDARTGNTGASGFEKVSSLVRAGREQAANAASAVDRMRRSDGSFNEETTGENPAAEDTTTTGPRIIVSQGFEKVSSLAKAGRDRVATTTKGRAKVEDPTGTDTGTGVGGSVSDGFEKVTSLAEAGRERVGATRGRRTCDNAAEEEEVCASDAGGFSVPVGFEKMSSLALAGRARAAGLAQRVEIAEDGRERSVRIVAMPVRVGSEASGGDAGGRHGGADAGPQEGEGEQQVQGSALERMRHLGAGGLEKLVKTAEDTRRRLPTTDTNLDAGACDDTAGVANPDDDAAPHGKRRRHIPPSLVIAVTADHRPRRPSTASSTAFLGTPAGGFVDGNKGPKSPVPVVIDEDDMGCEPGYSPSFNHLASPTASLLMSPRAAVSADVRTLGESSSSSTVAHSMSESATEHSVVLRSPIEGSMRSEDGYGDLCRMRDEARLYCGLASGGGSGDALTSHAASAGNASSAFVPAAASALGSHHANAGETRGAASCPPDNTQHARGPPPTSTAHVDDTPTDTSLLNLNSEPPQLEALSAAESECGVGCAGSDGDGEADGDQENHRTGVCGLPGDMRAAVADEEASCRDVAAVDWGVVDYDSTPLYLRGGVGGGGDAGTARPSDQTPPSGGDDDAFNDEEGGVAGAPALADPAASIADRGASADTMASGAGSAVSVSHPPRGPLLLAQAPASPDTLSALSETRVTQRCVPSGSGISPPSSVAPSSGPPVRSRGAMESTASAGNDGGDGGGTCTTHGTDGHPPAHMPAPPELVLTPPDAVGGGAAAAAAAPPPPPTQLPRARGSHGARAGAGVEVPRADADAAVGGDGGGGSSPLPSRRHVLPAAYSAGWRPGGVGAREHAHAGVRGDGDDDGERLGARMEEPAPPPPAAQTMHNLLNEFNKSLVLAAHDAAAKVRPQAPSTPNTDAANADRHPATPLIPRSQQVGATSDEPADAVLASMVAWENAHLQQIEAMTGQVRRMRRGLQERNAVAEYRMRQQQHARTGP